MSLTKLTLSLDKKTIEEAKRYSVKHKLSLSKMISRYFQLLSGEEEKYSPIVSRLLGILPAKMNVEEHKKFLQKKYKF